jgi:hypothetical protein
MSSIVSDRRGVISAGWVPTDPLQFLSLISGGRVEVDGGGGGVGAGELASPSVSSASAQLELMSLAETHEFMLIHTTRKHTAVKTMEYNTGQASHETHADRELRNSLKRRSARPMYELGRERARRRGR